MIYEATIDFNANEYFYPFVESVALRNHCTIMQRGDTIRVFGKEVYIKLVKEQVEGK